MNRSQAATSKNPIDVFAVKRSFRAGLGIAARETTVSITAYVFLNVFVISMYIPINRSANKRKERSKIEVKKKLENIPPSERKNFA